MDRWGKLVGGAALIALVGVLTAGATSAEGEGEPCHEGHCHGAAICGGGWKRHLEPVSRTGPDEGAASAAEACETVRRTLAEEIAAGAAEACARLHPCAACPDGCSGCDQAHPSGRLHDEPRASPAEATGAGWRCTVEATAAYRCECGWCKPSPTDAGAPP